MWLILLLSIAPFLVAAIYARWFLPHPALFRVHAHNDYVRRRPLFTALSEGFTSVEADVWPVNGTLLVGHDRKDLRPLRTLRRLYLDPLAALVRKQGSVVEGMQEPFQLLVEIKAGPSEAIPLLEEELKRLVSIVVRYEDDIPVEAPIRVVLTGKYPRKELLHQRVRLFACDGRFADVGSGIPVSFMPLVSDDWRWHFTWRGKGPFPADQRKKLRELVAAAHADGRRTRFWGAPAGPFWVRRAVWAEMADAGVDFLATDNLRSLRRWFSRMRP